MAIIHRTRTVPPIQITVLHTAVAKQCVLQITNATGPFILSRKLNGVIIDGPFFDTTQIGLKLGQTIPFGTIRASLPPGTAQNTVLTYTVFTGLDVAQAPIPIV
jgi:hypothetical protein